MDYKKILPIFSYIFHPIFISLYGLLLHLWLSKSKWNSMTIVLFIQVIILTILLPLSIFFLMKAIGMIKSFTEATIAERKFPLLLQIIFLLLLIRFSSYIEEIPPLYYFYIGGCIAAIVALLLTFFNFKVSLHMIGIVTLFFFCVSLGVYYSLSLIPLLSIVIICIGNVASSRLYMKSHNAEELLVGCLIGGISQTILWVFFL